MKLTEEKISSELIYDGKVVRLRKDTVRLPNGEKAFREVVHNSGGACVIAEFDGAIYFVKQFRYAYGDVLLELPAGKINEGEDPINTARRELEEETGLIATELKHIATIYPTPAYIDEKIYIYMASGVKRGVQSLDEDEFLAVEKIPVSTVKEMLKNGEIHDAKTLVALYKYFSL